MEEVGGPVVSQAGVQLYLRQLYLRQKAPLWRQKPWSVTGRAVRQLEALFSLASSFALLSEFGNVSKTEASVDASSCTFLKVYFALDL